MLGNRKKSMNNKATKKAKPSFSFKALMNDVNSLNAQNYGSAPAPVKVFLLLLIVFIIAVVAYFALIRSTINDIETAENEQAALLETYKGKEAKARYLDEYKQQVADMNVEFNNLLNQLPKDTRVSDLVDSINMVGSGSGIRFKDITAEPEAEKELFIEQPIRITALGDYHQFGNFVSGIAAIPRIITMHNFELVNKKPSLEVMPELEFVLYTKTYRTKPEGSDKDKKDKDAAKANGTGSSTAPAQTQGGK